MKDRRAIIALRHNKNRKVIAIVGLFWHTPTHRMSYSVGTDEPNSFGSATLKVWRWLLDHGFTEQTIDARLDEPHFTEEF